MTRMNLGNIQSFTQEALTRIRSTAMAPALWLAGVIGVIFLSAAAVFTAQGAIVLAGFSFGIAALAAISAILANIYFVFRDPDRLQSEEYVLRTRAMTLIGEKGKGFTINPVDLEDVIDPGSPRDKRKLKPAYQADEKSLPSSSSKEIRQTIDTELANLEGGSDDEE